MCRIHVGAPGGTLKGLLVEGYGPEPSTGRRMDFTDRGRSEEEGMSLSTSTKGYGPKNPIKITKWLYLSCDHL